MFHNITAALVVVMGLAITTFTQVMVELVAHADPNYDTRKKLLTKRLLCSLLGCVNQSWGGRGPAASVLANGGHD